MSEFAGVSTVLTVGAVAAVNYCLSSDTAFTTGVSTHQNIRQNIQPRTGYTQRPSLHEALGTTGLLAYGSGFGAMVAGLHAFGRRSIRRTARKAEDKGIEVKEKTETSAVPYFKNIPRTIVDKRTLDRILSTVPRDQWENPPEDSFLFALKCYAETYGEGKATRMGWWDYWYLRVNMPSGMDVIGDDDFQNYQKAEYLKWCDGKVPLKIPFALSQLDTGATVQWQGKELFAGDQCRTPVSHGNFATQFLENTAFYRKGLAPWQRGLEIGMAHGYFIIGPFVSLGPLRETPEAATVGLLAGVAVIGAVSGGGLLFGEVQKPRFFDRPGDKRAAGFKELIQGHALGGIGGAGFAHMLLTVFASLY